MSKKLIYLEDAIDAINALHEKPNAWLDSAVDAVMTLPSAQPEIIRCKECKHWDTSWQNDYAPNYHYCLLVDGTRRDDFYCADAERRTDG